MDPIAVWQEREAQQFDTRTRGSGRLEALVWTARRAQEILHSSQKVAVDFGCGTGLVAALLDNANVIGIDGSLRMLSLARERMRAVSCQDLRSPAIRKHSVDVAFLLFVLDDYPNTVKKHLIEEVAALLSASGHLLVATYHPDDERMGNARSRISRDVHRLPVYLETPNFYRRLLTAGGFEVVNEETLVTQGSIESSEGLNRRFFVAEGVTTQ
jgi:SAM-dependent methyltransferase